MTSSPELTKWVAVSGSALRHNARAICGYLETADRPAKPLLIAVVKADAYGHGLVPAARIFEDAGAALLAVTTSEEALELRAGGIAADILVFLPPPASQVAELAATGVHLTVAGADDIARLQSGAEKAKRSVRAHLKIDSGMGRLGVLPGQAADAAKTVASTPWLELAGVYTHFARALEADASPTRRQFETFQKVLNDLAAAGVDPGLRHCANSAAMLMDARYWLDAVRPGTILYGQYPASHLPRSLALKDSWKLHVRVAAVREVPAGTAIGYGGEFVTRRATRLAVLPIGYSDGFAVAPASVNAGVRGVKSLLASLRPGYTGPTVAIRDRKAPVVGRIAMQLTSIDVTDIPGVAVGDIVTVPARRLMTSSRIPRIYEE